MVSVQAHLLWTVVELPIEVSIALLSQQVAAEIQVIVVLKQKQRAQSQYKFGPFGVINSSCGCYASYITQDNSSLALPESDE